MNLACKSSLSIISVVLSWHAFRQQACAEVTAILGSVTITLKMKTLNSTPPKKNAITDNNKIKPQPLSIGDKHWCLQFPRMARSQQPRQIARACHATGSPAREAKERQNPYASSSSEVRKNFYKTVATASGVEDASQPREAGMVASTSFEFSLN